MVLVRRQPAQVDSLVDLLGGRRGAADATVPPVAFVAAWWASDTSIPAGVVAAVVAGALLAVFRLRRGHRPAAVLLGLLGTCVAALVVLYTGRAADFFLVQLLGNAASALAWAVSIAVRWPLLGVVVAVALRQGSRWRRDPALLAAYARGSVVWVVQYLVRIAVFLPLYATDRVVALGVARVALSWPLVATCLGVSWWVVRRALPAGHPGLRGPVEPRATGDGAGPGRVPAREPADGSPQLDPMAPDRG